MTDPSQLVCSQLCPKHSQKLISIFFISALKNVWLDPASIPLFPKSHWLGSGSCQLHLKYICLQSAKRKCFSWFFFFFSCVSVISCDSANWLRAQDAAASLCRRPWQRLGMGQRWHGQCDAGEVCVPPPTTTTTPTLHTHTPSNDS